jgi:hypothetical protein
MQLRKHYGSEFYKTYSEPIIGKPIKSIKRYQDKHGTDYILFDFDTEQHFYEVNGDCCSRSWIEHYTEPNDIVGKTILSVEDYDDERTEISNGNVVQNYETRFKTLAGDIVVEYRNESNGYYSGSLRYLNFDKEKLQKYFERYKLKELNEKEI